MAALKVKLNKRQLKDLLKDHGWYLKENTALEKKVKKQRRVISKLNADRGNLLIENERLYAKYAAVSNDANRVSKKDKGIIHGLKEDIEGLKEGLKAEVALSHTRAETIDKLEKEARALRLKLEEAAQTRADDKASMMALIDTLSTFPGMSINEKE